MNVHIYDMMYPGYKPPTKRNNFQPITLPHVPQEDNDFYMKVINQYDNDILVYMETPPARKNEHVTGKLAKWDGWTGPTKTLRDDAREQM